MNIAFIPVRGGSKSIPLKNIKIINEKPLVYWTLKAACEAECIDKVIVATDSTEIKKTVLNFGFKKSEVYDRKPENATDTASTESVMLEYIEFANLRQTDTFILIQATSPLLTSKLVDEMYKKYTQSDADSIFSGVREKQFHWIETDEGIKPINYNPLDRPRRQDFQGIIAENGACYMSSVKSIVDSKCRMSGKIDFYEFPPETAYEIDEPEDFVIIESIMKNRNKT